MTSPAGPSFSRRRRTCVSTVRVSMTLSYPQTSLSNLSRSCSGTPLHQCPQQFEFKAGEMHLLAVNANLMTSGIDGDRAGLQAFVSFFAAPQNCPNAQHDFARTERFRHVIVRSEFQTYNAIDLFCFRR